MHGDEIYIANDYSQLISWICMLTEPWSRLRVWRVEYDTVFEGPKGFTQELPLAALVNDF